MTCALSPLQSRTSGHGLEGGSEAPAVPADVALETHVHVVPGAAQLLRLRLGVTQLSQPRGIRIWASVNLSALINKVKYNSLFTWLDSDSDSDSNVFRLGLQTKWLYFTMQNFSHCAGLDFNPNGSH